MYNQLIKIGRYFTIKSWKPTVKTNLMAIEQQASALYVHSCYLGKFIRVKHVYSCYKAGV